MEIDLFCSNIKVFTVTFDQFNASVLNNNNNNNILKPLECIFWNQCP